MIVALLQFHSKWAFWKRLTFLNATFFFFCTARRLSSSDLHVELLWGLSGKEATYQRKRYRRQGFDPWVVETPLEEEIIHSCILAWKIPRTEESGRLHSIASTVCGVPKSRPWLSTHTTMQKPLSLSGFQSTSIAQQLSALITWFVVKE